MDINKEVRWERALSRENNRLSGIVKDEEYERRRKWNP